MNETKLWIIEPRDPLIVRDGRPFSNTPGARATSLPFPMPATVAGAMRTRAGSNSDGIFDISRINEVKQIGLYGPLLAQVSGDDTLTWFAPAPADALMLENKKNDTIQLKPLVPLVKPNDVTCNLSDDLALVGMQRVDPAKPYGDAPRFWNWKHFADWLSCPNEQTVDPKAIGLSGLERETRTHVRVGGETQTADPGALFQTQGLEFTTKAGRARLAIGIVTDAKLQAGFGSLGGERRVVCWRPSTATLPVIPDELSKQIAKDKACRIILLTPAYFDEGYHPRHLLETHCGITPTLVAAAVQRPQTVSGWDYEYYDEIRKQRGRPKPTKRLAPAGTVFFLRFDAEASVDAMQNWVRKLWLTCVSDKEQDRLDGAGMAAIGVWNKNGELATMEVNDESNT